MRNVLIVLAMLAGGCVFQESPEIPADGNNDPNNFTNNLLNNLTNNVLNNVLNNFTNGSTNNTTNGSTNNTTNGSTNNTVTPDCSPRPEFCEGYFQCGEGFLTQENGISCHYDCGTCAQGSECLSSADLCSIPNPLWSPPGARSVFEFADSRTGMAVLWSDNTYGVINPDGTFRELDFEVGPADIQTISASATKWVAIGQPSTATVTVGINGGGKFQPLTRGVGSNFGQDVDLARVENFGGEPGLDSGIGVVGAPGEADAFIISKAAASDWGIGSSLAAEMTDVVAFFGEKVAISPNGKTVLVSSSRGVEVFVAGQMGKWSFAQTLTLNQPSFGEEFVVGDSYAVVASERVLNFYAIEVDGSVDVSPTFSAPVSATARVVSLDIISAGDGRTVVFTLIRQPTGAVILQLWQPGLGKWIPTNTLVATDLGFSQFVVMEAGVFDGPMPPSSSFPVFAMMGVDGSDIKVRLVPLFETSGP